jgi:aminocarboxymuconate-semialdehyde decarboxylase
VRIDVHNHAIPERVLDLVTREEVFGVRRDGDTWIGGNHVQFHLQESFLSPVAKLAELELVGIDAAVVSAAPPLFYYEVDRGAALELCAAINEGLREFCSHNPDRLKWMAHAPLQDSALAVEILERQAAEPGCVGVEVGSSVAGTRLDERRLEPFWEAAEQLRLPVLIHPDCSYHDYPALESYYLQNVIGYPFETTVAVERLVAAGILARYPDLRVILVHAGGFFPYQAGRLRHATTVRPELAESPPDPWEFLPQLWFDVITHDPGALRFLIDRVGVEQVVLGTDMPFDMGQRSALEDLRAVASDDELRRITEGTPEALFRFHPKRRARVSPDGPLRASDRSGEEERQR